MSRDTPDKEAAPPAARPDATATTGVGVAGGKQKQPGSLVLHFNPYKSSSASIRLVPASACFTSAGGFLCSPVAMDTTGQQVAAVQGEILVTLEGALAVERLLEVGAADVAVFRSFEQWASHSCGGETVRGDNT